MPTISWTPKAKCHNQQRIVPVNWFHTLNTYVVKVNDEYTFSSGNLDKKGRVAVTFNTTNSLAALVA